jgi:predicted nucleic acid-binding protein
MSDPADRLVLLDSEPVGLVTNPRVSEKADRCKRWLQTLISAGVRVMVPEIIDYEVRRELIRAGRHQGLASLDFLSSRLGLLPCSGSVLIEAAGLWAQARRQGQPTAGNKALDIDVILAATAKRAADTRLDVIIATGNVEHLARFVAAKHWSAIVP